MVRPSVESSSQDNTQLKSAIDRLVTAIRENQSGADEINALMVLVSQLRDANQNLVLASVRAQILQEEAEERNRQQNEFLAMLAHELRNPMAPISNAANLLSKIASAHPLLPKIQSIVSRQVEHMARLIDDLLDASRIANGKITLHRSKIAVNEAINRSVEIVQPSIEQRRQHLIVEHLSAELCIEGDLVRLSQALSNLLINASKFTPEGGQIGLKVRQQANAIHITITDNGVGIAPELLPYIFDLFRQGPRTLARSEGGLGIGLSVAKGLIEMHGGKIAAQSRGPRLGSEFEVVLPLSESRALALPSVTAGHQAPLTDSRRILLIEDNVDTNSTLRMLLEVEGHHVMSALDGLSGLSLATAHTYDVIVCDIGLPGMNGYGVIAQIRQRAIRPGPFAIALSGYGQPEDRRRAIEAGFDEYIVKPVKADYLLYLIASRESLSH